MKKGNTKIVRTINGLTSLFYSLAIANSVMNIVIEGTLKPEAIGERNIIKNLRKRGIAVVRIVDKNVEETYHEIGGIEKLLNEFVKKNKKWKWEKENSFGIKTGRYILTRVYRKYYKKRELEIDDDY